MNAMPRPTATRCFQRSHAWPEGLGDIGHGHESLEPRLALHMRLQPNDPM